MQNIGRDGSRFPLSVNAIINDTIIDDYNQYIKHIPPNEEILHAATNLFSQSRGELFDFTVSRHSMSKPRLIDEHFYKLFPQLHNQNIKADTNIYLLDGCIYRFLKQYERLVTQSTDYNTNNDLQIRIIKGAAYFEQKLRPFHKLAEATNLPTDNKELRKKTNNTLEEFLNTLTQKLSLLQYG